MDLLFDAFSAWNSFGLFLMSSVFLLIGCGLLSYYLYWQIKANHIKAKISAIMVSHSRQSKDKETDWKDGEGYKNVSRDQEEKSEKVSASGKAFGFVFLLFFLGIPLAFVGIGAYSGYKFFDIKANGVYAEATVIRNDSSYDSESGTTYKAVLSFKDRSGRMYEVKDTISYGSSPSFATGTVLGVYYDPEDPKIFVIDDFWHNMLIAIIFSGFGVVFIGVIVLIALFGNNKTKQSDQSSSSKKQSYMGEIYYPVYQYKAPNGETIEQISSLGSNSFLSRMPGDYISLRMIPKAPYKVHKNSLILLILGLIFLAPGLFIGAQAAKTFELNFFTIFVPLVFIGFIIFKISQVISKIPGDARKQGLAFLKSQMSGNNDVSSDDFNFEIKSSDKRPKRRLETSEIAARVKSQISTYRVSGYIAIFLALAAFIGAYYAAQNMQKFINNGVRTIGEIVDIESRYDSSSDSSGYTYYGVAEFTDKAGKKVRFRDSVGASSPMHKRGDDVDIIYLSNNSQEAMIDRGIWNWALSAGVGLLGLLLLYSSYHSFHIVNKHSGSRMRFKKRV